MKKVITDCDPGHDDAFAIMLALTHLDVIGITTVGGNQVLEKVTVNALKILEVLNRTDVPVYIGHAGPTVVDLVIAPMFHGESGMDGPVLPHPNNIAQTKHGVDFIIDTVMSTDDVTLIATGPLTNIAAAINREPGIAKRVTEISIMGGSVTFGNWTPAAEFNIFVDPEAALKVFESGIHIKMCGINLTRQAILAQKEIDDFDAIGTRASKFCADLLRFFMAASSEAAGAGVSVHDPCAVAWLIDPTLFKTAKMHVTVELRGEYTRGMTVCDYRHLRSSDPAADLSRIPMTTLRGKPANCEAALELDVEKFLMLIRTSIKTYK